MSRLASLERKAGWLLTPLGIAPLPDGVEVLRTGEKSPHDWVFMRLHDDPTYVRGALVVPDGVKRRLRRLDRLGVEFDELLIGHEVDKDDLDRLDPRRPADLAALLNPAQRKAPPPPGVDALRSAARIAGAALRAGGNAAAVGASGLLALPAALDPVLIGAVTDGGSRDPGVPAALLLIAQWT